MLEPAQQEESRSLTVVRDRQPSTLLSPYLPDRSTMRALGLEASLGDYWRILRKRKWTVIASLVIVLTLVTIVSLRMTPQYLATSRIAINEADSDFTAFSDSRAKGGSDWDYVVDLETQVRILLGDTLALQTIEALHLDADRRFVGSAAAARQAGVGQAQNPKRNTELVAMFHSGLAVNTVPKTRIIEIRYLHRDPKLAAEIANGLVNTYVEQNYKTRFESTMQASEWLSQQLAELKLKVEVSQEKLVRYQREQGIVGIDEKQNIVTTKLDDLNRNLTAAESDRIQKEATYRMVNSGDLSAIAGLAPTHLLETMREQKANLQDQIAAATLQFGPAHPRVVELNTRLAQAQATIDDEVKKIAARAEADYRASLQRQEMLRAAFEQQKRQANQLNENAIQYNILKRDVDSNRQLYEDLLRKLKEAGITSTLRSSNVRIVDAARAPLFPAKPNIPFNVALAFFAGSLGGVVLAFVIESLDTTVRTPEQVTELANLNTLGIIPLNRTAARLPKYVRHMHRQLAGNTQPGGERIEIMSQLRPRSEIAEAYRALRTSLLLSSTGAAPKVILITSALPGEGKTTTSSNTAIVLAQRGARVLLVDADLRRPSLHNLFGLDSRIGLSGVLAGQTRLEDALVVSSIVPNLSVLPAGDKPPHPAELIGSEQMGGLIERWRQEYDHVVMDSPPALSVTDAVLLSVAADITVLVVRSGQTSKAALRRAREVLAYVNAKVAGVVVNAIDVHSPDAYHYYYYGSKYANRYYTEKV